MTSRSVFSAVKPLLLSVSLSALSLGALSLGAALAQTAEPPMDPRIARLTVEQKAAQMQNRAPALPSAGLTAYEWWNEGLHGVARAGEATVFPQAIGLAATWNPALLKQVGDVVSTEARAKFNSTDPAGDHPRYFGLTLWSPNINIFRDPRWGRGQETYGEDPFLTSRLAEGFVTGLQGPDPQHPKVVASVKHLAVHSGPEAGRHGFAASVSPYDLEMTYLPAFRYSVMTTKAQSVMCAYNAVAGVPACASDLLLKTYVRDAWGFKGYVVTDCDAIYDMTRFHFYRLNDAESSAESLKAGVDLNCGNAYAALPEAVSRGLIPESLMDQSLNRLLDVRKRLGIDGAPSPWSKISPDAINTPQAQGLALQAAEQSLVLLKNNGVLPLKPGQTVAVIGPNADTQETLRGNYNGIARQPVTPLAGLRAQLGAAKVLYAQGATLAEGVPTTVPETALRTSDGAAGLTASYYANADFTGAPVETRTERTVNLEFMNRLPVKALKDGPYSIRWSGQIAPPAAGTYRLKVFVDRCWSCEANQHDEVRLYLDDKPVIVDTGDGKSLETELTFDSAAARRLRLEYRHVGGDWGVRLQWIAPAQPQIDEAVKAAQAADAIVAFVGLSPDIEGEELQILVPGFDRGDRTDLGLPRTQEDLLKAVKATGKPLVVVLLSGSAVALNWADAHADAVVAAWYPGEAGGTAIARTLTGESNPSGRLPVTFYRSVQDLPPFIDYRMEGRTYRYFKGKPLYPFGHGLSYTRFSYSDLKLDTNALNAGQPLRLSVRVRNTGPRAGDEVVQLYVKRPDAFGLNASLAAFSRVSLKPGESRTVVMTIDPRDLSTVTLEGERAIRAGAYSLSVGGGQPGFAQTLNADFSISGQMALPK